MWPLQGLPTCQTRAGLLETKGQGAKDSGDVGPVFHDHIHVWACPIVTARAAVTPWVLCNVLVAIRLYLRWSLTEIMETITVLQRKHLIHAFVLDLSFICKIKVCVPY